MQTRDNRALFLMATLAMLLVVIAPASAAADGPVGSFEPAPCTFKGAEGFKPGAVECGYLAVPQRHSEPDGPSSRLAVAIIKQVRSEPGVMSSAQSSESSPLVLAQGGPGGSTIDTFAPLVQSGELRGLLEDRDIVLFDQRGTLYSEPPLLCTESISLTEQTITQHLSREEDLERSLDAERQCRDRLAGQGIDLASFNSLENAADIEALRQALGYDQINLYGVSYGTLLALHAMENYPEGLRSVILDGVLPPQINFLSEAPRSHDRAFTELFRACAADPGCKAAYGDLERVTFGLVAALNKNPARVPIVDRDTGAKYDAVLDGDTFLDLLVQLLYASPLIPLLPAIVYDAQAGDFTLLARVWPVLAFDRTQAEGMYLSTVCAEDVDFKSEAQDLTGIRPALASLGAFDTNAVLKECQVWNVPDLGPKLDNPVASNVPALLFNGQFDPITPPSFGDVAAQSLSHSYSYTFPGLGHGALTDDRCAQEIAQAFLRDPGTRPRAGCLASRRPLSFMSPSNTVMTKSIGRLLIAAFEGDFRRLLPMVLGVGILLTVFAVWPFSWFVRRMQRIPSERRVTARLAPWLAVVAAVLTVALLAGVVAIIMEAALSGSDLPLLLGVPRAWAWLFVLPALIAVLGMLMVAVTVLAWRKRFWGVWRRIYYTVLTAATAGLSVACVAAGLMFPLL